MQLTDKIILPAHYKEFTAFIVSIFSEQNLDIKQPFVHKAYFCPGLMHQLHILVLQHGKRFCPNCLYMIHIYVLIIALSCSLYNILILQSCSMYNQQLQEDYRKCYLLETTSINMRIYNILCLVLCCVFVAKAGNCCNAFARHFAAQAYRVNSLEGQASVPVTYMFIVGML